MFTQLDLHSQKTLKNEELDELQNRDTKDLQSSKDDSILKSSQFQTHLTN